MLLRRIANLDLGLANFWQGVTGGLEEGEDLISAAKRELKDKNASRRLHQTPSRSRFIVKVWWLSQGHGGAGEAQRSVEK